MGTFTVITAPTVEPITLNEAKNSLRVISNDDDQLITSYIKAAREFAEKYCNLQLMTQTVEQSYNAWPAGDFNLDTWPLQSIDSVKYDDTSSPITEQTLTVDTDYYADTTTIGGRVVTNGGWPSVAVKPKPIRIRMTAGYSSRDNVPHLIKEGIKAYLGYLYEGDPDMKQIAKNILWSERRL